MTLLAYFFAAYYLFFSVQSAVSDLDIISSFERVSAFAWMSAFLFYRFSEKLSESSETLAKYLDGKDAEVAGTTYSDLKQLTQKIENCGYFQNFVPDEEETEEVVTVEEVSPSLETPAVESVAGRARFSILIYQLKIDAIT